MAENLAYIPFIDDSSQEGIWVYDFNGTGISQAMDSKDYGIYGCLYNWKMAKAVCPEGWHLPSRAEWEKLIDYVRKCGYLNDDSQALKAASGWMGGAGGNGTDAFGFKSLPAGLRNPAGDFYYIGGRTEYWTSTQRDSTYYWAYDLVHTTKTIEIYSQMKNFGMSVRCVKNSSGN